MMDVLIVGVGSIGQKEIIELREHPQIQIVGAVDTDPARRQWVPSWVPVVCEEVDEAIERTEPDLVRIATPPRTHHRISLSALEAGSDVYIEKVMTLNSEKAANIVETAAETGQSVYVRRNAIYTPVYQRAWKKLDSLGEVRHVHWIEPVGEYSDWTKSKQDWLRDLPGGIVSEHLPHALYTVRWYLGEEPVVDQVRYDDMELHVTLKSEEKSAKISYVKPTDLPMLLDITGERGTLRVNHSSMRIQSPCGFEDAESVERRTTKANLYDLYGSVKNVLRLAQHYVRRESGVMPDPLYSQSDNYRQFTDILRGGVNHREFAIDGVEGLRNVELFESIWERTDERTKLFDGK